MESIINDINQLINISIIVKGSVALLSNDQSKSFPRGELSLFIQGSKDVEIFVNTLEIAYHYKKDIPDTISLKSFERSFVNLIWNLKNGNLKCDTNELKLFFEKFLISPIYESEVFYELYGIIIDQPEVHFGSFTVYNYDKSIDKLRRLYPDLDQTDIYFVNRRSKYLLSVKVLARENAKAVEIADKLCETFENVFSFIIADLSHQFKVKVNVDEGLVISNVICGKTVMGAHVRADLYIPINLDNLYFRESSENDIIWNLIGKSKKSPIEIRLLNSIEWIGKAINDKDISKSLVQFVFAIEAMLQFNDKILIIPSIVSQLSDWLAFILGNDLDQRVKISKKFKEIYQKRSAIAHGGISQIKKQDLEIALKISKGMVKAFLIEKPFNQMKTIEEVNKYISELKFK